MYDNFQDVVDFFESLERGDMFYYDVKCDDGSYARFTSVFVSIININRERESVHIKEFFSAEGDNLSRISYLYFRRSSRLVKL